MGTLNNWDFSWPTYMQEYGHEVLTEGAKMKVVMLALKGTAGRWMVTLHNSDSPELRNFTWFMTALQWQFEDPLANCKARDHIKTVQ